MEKEQFGSFVAERRKEKKLTQKEIADMLRISDKAVSKWERGLSYPDITMLEPLADILSVSLTELVEGRIMEIEDKIEKKEVDEMLRQAMDLNNEKLEKEAKYHRFSRICAIISIIIASLAECSVLLFLKNVDWFVISLHLPTVLFLIYFFGIYFWVVAKEKLPGYYDEKKVTEYKDGSFSMNMPGVTFNNNNWKPILKALRLWSMIVALIYPVITILMDRFIKFEGFAAFLLFIPTFGALFSCFIPLHHAAKKYEST
ncbi:MAG: helix-turn-helix domain-containing protein [Lachnospiraceae bacterium]|nr:helix-turn-helix domain-containing protein [Lachnospiraceae bacterium]